METITGQGSIVYSRTHALAVTVVLPLFNFFWHVFYSSLRILEGCTQCSFPKPIITKAPSTNIRIFLKSETFFSVFAESVGRLIVANIKGKKKQRCCLAACSLTVHNPLFFCSKIVMEYINVTFLLVNKIKMFGMLLNYVHPSSPQKDITKKSYGSHNYFTLLAIVLAFRLHVNGFFRHKNAGFDNSP